ncbi:thioesterase II family protein [Streptomyces sp. NPDC059070]|uniref:thioesterase II family protein n=1 Tax=unclassified Streptomyces TaxID=2593676 RepID=UPI0034E2A95C
MTGPTTGARAGCLLRAPREDAALRLLCFHHAGGGASFFAPWPARVPPGVEVVPVQLPGRESRFREPRCHDAGALAETLAAELGPHLDRPYAVYGHSMGALVGFATVAALLRAGGPAPLALYVGAYAAPHLTPPLPPADLCGDAELARLLVDIGGLHPRFLGRADWLRALLPVLRDDLRICAGHRDAGLPEPGDAERRAPFGITAFAGADDRLVDPGAVAAWRLYADEFRLVTVEGGHFFPREAPEPFFAELGASLAALLPAARP